MKKSLSEAMFALPQTAHEEIQILAPELESPQIKINNFVIFINNHVILVDNHVTSEITPTHASFRCNSPESIDIKLTLSCYSGSSTERLEPLVKIIVKLPLDSLIVGL